MLCIVSSLPGGWHAVYSVLPALPGGLHLAGTRESAAAAAQGGEDTRPRLPAGTGLLWVCYGLVSLNIIKGDQEWFFQGVSQNKARTTI